MRSDLVFKTRGDAQTAASDAATEKLRITHDGKIKLGSGGAPVGAANVEIRYDNPVLLIRDTAESSADNDAKIGFGNNTHYPVAYMSHVWDGTNGALTFHTRIGGNEYERLRIDSSGHLLPGTNASYDIGENSSSRWRNIYGGTLSLTSYATIGAIVAADPGSSYYAYNNRIGSGLAVVGTTRLFGKVGLGDNAGTVSSSRSYVLDISNTDNNTGHGVLTDQRGRSDLIIRNKSGTLYSYSQLMFTNGNDGFNSATFLRHTKGGYLQNENYVGDLILMTRVAGNGSANPDFREKTTWPGGTAKAKQIWWANGTGQQTNSNHNGWHHFAEQNPQGNDQYQYFTLDLGSASYSRAGLARYTILWNTGHASGTGHQTGEFRWFNHHSNKTCNILEHIILRRGYNNGSYYGWTDAPLMELHHSSNSDNNACIHLKCQGRRSSGYAMGLYVSVFIDLYAPKSSNGNVTPGLRARGTSAPSDMSSSAFTNQGRNASYVTYQSSAPPLAQNP
tara:strand:- start:1090 stop:2604 length:1515 start_codon:yes stop_codon:yes gene_type:complete